MLNSKMKKGLEEYNKKVQRGEIERKKARNPLEKWEEDDKAKLSLRKSINAKCWDCCCGQRVEIALCAAKNCPLWYVRPYQKDRGE